MSFKSYNKNISVYENKYTCAVYHEAVTLNNSINMLLDKFQNLIHYHGRQACYDGKTG